MSNIVFFFYNNRKKFLSMTTKFVDIHDMANHEFVPEGETANNEYYTTVWKRLYEPSSSARILRR